MEIFLSFVKAFVVGGLLCVIGQLLIDFTKLTPARILTVFVVAGVVLTMLGLYEPVVKFAGAGATIPIVGFGYSLARGQGNLGDRYFRHFYGRHNRHCRRTGSRDLFWLAGFYYL